VRGRRLQGSRRSVARIVRAWMLVLGLMACSRIAAREPEPGTGVENPGDRALDRTLVAGTLIEAKIEVPRSGRRNLRGETLTAIVSADVQNARRWAVIPAGSRVELRITGWRPADTARQTNASIRLEVLSVTVRGRMCPVRATAELRVRTDHRSGGPAVVVAPASRILFVLSEGFTAGRPPSGLP
jgi:hypothetical protein